VTAPPPDGPAGDTRPEWLRHLPGPGGPEGGPGAPGYGWGPAPSEGRPGYGWSPAPPPPERPRGRVRPLVGVLVLVLVVGLALSGLVFATRRDPGTPSAAGPGPAAPATSGPAAAAPTTPAPSASATTPAIREVQRAVAELRGLQFRRRVPVTVESPARLAKRLLRVLDEETNETQVRRQGRAMELLGQLPRGTDLPKLLERLQAESVLGFYLPGKPPDKGGLYVRSSRGLDPYARIILAHELTHAVTDQRYDLTRADRLAAAGGRQDELAAYTGLVEGDATLLMQRYLAERLTPREQADAAVAVARDGTPMRDAAPAAVRESMLFPYQEGLRFVQALYQRGGWAAVDRAYRDPPRTTEQLLHPERYLGPRDQPQPVPVPDLSGRLGGGWRPAADTSFGEFDARLLLRGESGSAGAGSAAEGWDGGRLRTFQRGNGTALVIRTVWDSRAEAAEFCRAMTTWATSRFGPAASARRWSGAGQQTTLRCSGDRAAWLSAPDRPTLDRLSAALGTP
jgi:hypothetical protein